MILPAILMLLPVGQTSITAGGTLLLLGMKDGFKKDGEIMKHTNNYNPKKPEGTILSKYRRTIIWILLMMC